MSRLAVQFLDEGFHRVLFNAMPMPVLVVDPAMEVLEYNTAASQLLGEDKKVVLRRRTGEVLHCIHSTETEAGCGGATVCQDCVVRGSVRDSLRGRRVTRRLTQLELLAEGKRKRVDVRVSCQPITYQERSLVLLMLEGLND